MDKNFKVLSIVFFIVVFILGGLVGSFILRGVYMNGYREITTAWEETSNQIQDKCDVQIEEIIEKADKSCKLLLGIK